MKTGHAPCVNMEQITQKRDNYNIVLALGDINPIPHPQWVSRFNLLYHRAILELHNCIGDRYRRTTLKSDLQDFLIDIVMFRCKYDKNPRLICQSNTLYICLDSGIWPVSITIWAFPAYANVISIVDRVFHGTAVIN